MADAHDPSVDDHADDSRRRVVRRVVGEALDATVGRVSHTVGEMAVDLTGTTAEQVIEDLEPYLIEEAIPRIVDGLTPHLIEVVVPRVVDGLQEHLATETVPEVLTAMTPQLVDQVLPRILADLRPYLEQELVPEVVESLMPTIEQDIAPRVVDALMPKIRDEVAPDLVDALMPKIRDEVAPDLVDALMPRIRDQVAPDLVDALMPKIRDEVAPDLVDALMPKIRVEVVPTILDDIVDDPRVRDLIREQSQGLFLDALESVRENLADADNLVERIGQRLLRRPPRPEPESAVALVLDATGGGQSVPLRTTFDDLAARRHAWQAMPMPPAPPGREYPYAGIVTRLLALAVDVGLTGWLISQGLAALVSLLDRIFDPTPAWLALGLSGLAAALVPLYMAVCWWLGGRTLGSWLVGTRVCTPDGANPGFPRALVRSWLLFVGLVVWVVSGVVTLWDPKRRTWLDSLLHTEVRYVVPDNQQHRYIRDAVLARRRQAASAAGAAAGSAPADGPAADGDVGDSDVGEATQADR